MVHTRSSRRISTGSLRDSPTSLRLRDRRTDTYWQDSTSCLQIPTSAPDRCPNISSRGPTTITALLESSDSSNQRVQHERRNIRRSREIGSYNETCKKRRQNSH